MCGIFGWIKADDAPLDEQEIRWSREAVRLMAHRGPDHQGEWLDGSVYMGHDRLSILDLSTAAHQPFTDDDHRFVLVYNGEIYNYLELKAELQAKGIVFRTTSDTEVLLAAFKQWGPEAFLKFDGMFAAGIHDVRSGKHYLFRDHLGQKPLYYHVADGQTAYASELRALLHLGRFQWRLDHTAFLKFLFNGYYIWDTTPVQGIRKLLPGHWLEIAGPSVKLHKYWDSIPGDEPLDLSLDQAAEQLSGLLDRSCEMTLRSDVPYGVFLSGGLDSSLVLASCKKFDRDIRAFCVGMGEADFCERHKAQAVAGHVGVEGLRIYSMDQQSVTESLDAFLSFSDEPHGDPGFVNCHFLAKSCRNEITVAIAGDGADELFAGYAPFLGLAYEGVVSSLPPQVVAAQKWLAEKCLPGNDTYVGLQFKLLAYLGGFPAADHTRFPLWLGSLPPEELARVCIGRNPKFFSRSGEPGTLLEEFAQVLARVDGRSRAQMLLYFYQKFFLPEFVCMHTDRAAMQNSLEVRSPFLSLPLIEFSNRLPDRFKSPPGKLKLLLRHYARRNGFPKLIWQQKKQGFTFPLARWLKSVLHPKMDELLSPESWPPGLVDHAYVERLKQEHLRGARNNYRIIYNLMVFAQWLRNFPQVMV